MTPKEMWRAYKKNQSKIGDKIDAWALVPLQPARWVLRGEKKTATASAL